MRRIKTVAAVVAVAMLVVAASGGGTASVTGIHTESGEASDIQAHTNIDMDGNDSTSHTVSIETDNSTTDPATRFVNNNTSRTFASNASMENQTSQSDSSAGSVWNATYTEGDFVDTEHDLHENVSAELVGANNSSTDVKDTSDPVYLNFSNTSTVVEVVTDEETAGDDESDDAAEVSTVEDEESWFGLSTSDESEVGMEEHDVSGQDSDVVIVMANDTVEDDFGSVASEASDQERLSGAWALGNENVLILEADGEKYLVPVFSEEAPSAWDEDHTYATYSEDYGGTPALVLNLGTHFEDTDELSVTALGGIDALDQRGSALLSDASVTPDRPDVASAFGVNIVMNMSVPLGVDMGAALGLLTVPMAVAPARRRRLVVDEDSEDSTGPETPASPVSPDTPGEDTSEDAEV